MGEEPGAPTPQPHLLSVSDPLVVPVDQLTWDLGASEPIGILYKTSILEHRAGADVQGVDVDGQTEYPAEKSVNTESKCPL